jgi:hypothetical protein
MTLEVFRTTVLKYIDATKERYLERTVQRDSLLPFLVNDDLLLARLTDWVDDSQSSRFESPREWRQAVAYLRKNCCQTNIVLTQEKFKRDVHEKAFREDLLSGTSDCWGTPLKLYGPEYENWNGVGPTAAQLASSVATMTTFLNDSEFDVIDNFPVVDQCRSPYDLFIMDLILGACFHKHAKRVAPLRVRIAQLIMLRYSNYQGLGSIVPPYHILHDSTYKQLGACFWDKISNRTRKDFMRRAKQSSLSRSFACPCTPLAENVRIIQSILAHFEFSSTFAKIATCFSMMLVLQREFL